MIILVTEPCCTEITCEEKILVYESTVSLQVYDMQFEVNEIEARQERYPSTISFLNLLNALIAKESDLSDRGRR